MSAPEKCSHTSVIAVCGCAAFAGVWFPFTRCFQPARWKPSTIAAIVSGV